MTATKTQVIRAALTSAAGGALDIESLRADVSGAADDGAVSISDPSSILAASFSEGGDWVVFVATSEQVGYGAALIGRVAIVTKDDIELADWDSVRANWLYWVGQGARFVGFDGDVEALPFAFDGDSWEGTKYDDAWGETDWVVDVDGEQATFRLEEKLISYSLPGDGVVPPGQYVDLAEGGMSMSTGEIGMSVWVDDDGAVWSSIWGCEVRFHGRSIIPFDALAYLPGPPSAVALIESEMLDAAAMRPVVEWVSACVQDWDPDVVVRCVGFDGTAAELLELTQPAG